MNKGTKLDFTLSEFILELIKKIDGSPIPVEISLNYYPDGEVDVTISPYRPISYNCPFNNQINNTEE